MNYLTLENVSKTYGEKVLFDKISLQINRSEKIALVAKNGTGKTTLLKVIAGEEGAEGERGKVWIYKDVRIGYLPQDPDFHPDFTILDAVLESENDLVQAVRRYQMAMLNPNNASEMETALALMDDLKAWDFEAKIKEILFKLNIKELDKTVSTLSGGQKKRLALAKLIIEEPELIILDEPTNHLDLDMIEWLEKYLQQPKLTIFMVTHDRYFLERVCNVIVELQGGNLYHYRGNYSEYLEKKAIREENESIEIDKGKKWLKKEIEWVRRMPKARGTKAKSRVDGYNKVKDKMDGIKTTEEMQIEIKGQRIGKKILELHNVGKSFGDLKIVENFDYKFKKKERVGIVGPNGAGKSTFLKLITKEIRPDTGKVVIGDTTAFGYYSQDGIQIKDDKRVIDVIRDIAEFVPLEKGQKLTASQMLERFLFPPKQQQVYVSQLSGGERRRLYLLTVLMENPNFLILDEPTNDLDIVTLNILEDFLMEFPGCLIIVSHDRYFMDKLVDHLFVFEGNGYIKDFNGNYTEYRAAQLEREREKRQEERAKKEKNTSPTVEESTSTLTFEQRKELNKLEKEIAKLEHQKTDITAKFNDPSLSPNDIQQLSKDLGELNNTIEEKEMRWMELADV